MKILRVSLFGRFRAEFEGHGVSGLEGSRVQHLFSYLLLNRDRPIVRELLASALWADHYTTDQSKTYLRKSLWQLHSALDAIPEISKSNLLQAGKDFIKVKTVRELWLDVALFEDAYLLLRDKTDHELDDDSGKMLAKAVQLYKGDLLEGWYQDWCLLERERYKQIYVTMLDKLMSYCEVRGEYEAGLSFGERVLREDVAREVTHRRMMRLRYLMGDRTGALHQYERCVASLKEELDIGPSRNIQALYEQIRTDKLDRLLPISIKKSVTAPGFSDVMDGLNTIGAELDHVQVQLHEAVRSVGDGKKRTDSEVDKA